MFKFIVIIFFFFITLPALAIVNIEKTDLASEESVQGELSVKFSGAGGNSNSQSSEIESRVQWNSESTQFVLLNYSYAKSEGVLSADKTFAHYRYIHLFKRSVTWETFFQMEDNAFKQLKLRTLAGAGIRFSFSQNNSNSRSRSGIGLFYSEEKYDDVLQSVEKVTRVNLYYTYQYQLNKTTRFVTTTYFQPVIDEFSDYRALEQLSLEFNLSDNLLYFVALDISYDNEPLAGLEKDDSSYNSGIKYRF